MTVSTAVDTDAATCPLRQRAIPYAWRPSWDWAGRPEDPDEARIWEALLPREAPRLYRLWREHEQTCPMDHHDGTRYPCTRTGPLHDQLMATDHFIEGRISSDMCDAPSVDGAISVTTLADMPATPMADLVIGRLCLEHTILFGDGGVGKGTLASKWIADLTHEGHTVLVVDYEVHPEEWSYRVHKLGGRTDLVRYVSPTLSMPGPIWEHADALTAAAQDACVVVVDSIVQACVGADPMDPETASSYGAAILQLARPVLSLAHVTKAGESRWPFGSIFWSNLARVTWSLTEEQGGLVLACRKANAHRKPPPQMVSIEYLEGSLDVSEKRYDVALAEMIADALGSKAMTVASIVSAIAETYGAESGEVKADSVRAALRRGLKASPKRFAAEGSGDAMLWRVV